MTMTIASDDAAGVIEFTVDGEVTGGEFDGAVEAMEAAIARHGKFSAVGVIRDFAGMELAAWWKDIRWGAGHLSKVGRVAVVTDIGWIAAATKGAGWMTPAEYRVFPLADLEAARAWARGLPAG